MTKRVTKANLHRSPLEKEENCPLKGYCPKSTNELSYHHSTAPASTNHLPASSVSFPKIRNPSSLARTMHQKPPTGLPTITNKANSNTTTSSFKENVPSTPGSFCQGPGDATKNSFPILMNADRSRKPPTVSDTAIKRNPRTLRNEAEPLQLDARYQNMMLGYFVPNAFAPRNEALKTASSSAVGDFQLARGSTIHPFSFKSPTPTHSVSTMHMELLPSPPNSTNSPANEPVCLPPESIQQGISNPYLMQHQEDEAQGFCPEHTVQTTSQIALDVTPSGCTMLEPETLAPSESEIDALLGTLATGRVYDEKFEFCSSEASKRGTKDAVCVKNFNNRTSNFSHHATCSSSFPTVDNSNNISQSRTVRTMSTAFLPQQSCEFPCEAASIEPDLTAQTILTPDDAKSSSWGRFSVLPPVMSSATPGDGSTVSCHSSLGSGQVGGMLSSFSPLTATDFPSTMFANSSRSSFSGRGSRNKRALSNSPLSAEGIDLNSIIRMSPTSLVTYLNGSRSSSSCVSPGSAGERSGCYGHLSARNSSSSPRSGSGSSGAKRSVSHSSISGAPPHHARETSSLSSDTSIKNDLLELENMLIHQAMQDLEAGCGLETMALNENQTFQHSTMVPECDNLRILPQSMASYQLEDYLPYSPLHVPSLQNYDVQIHEVQTVRPPAPSSLLPPTKSLPPPAPLLLPNKPQPSTSSGPLLSPSKPPPTYAQHMARKATLEKKSSSDSSQPSNSNSSSFESTESATAGGSSSTDSELLHQQSQRMYECEWVDCSLIFQDLEEFVSHIEKQHMDQRKGEEFICFWRNCPRRMHPFNQRYKLLMHMRVHSGDKPNKCTYTGCKKAFSRLENLKIHMRSHTGERPYSCPHQGCNKTFSNSSDRAKHQKTHQDMRPYICQVPGCGKRYTDPSSLRKHAKSSHAEKEPGRKKIRGGIEELDPKDLSECLVIKGLKPIPQYDVSPPERTDSGLGKSPRGSHLGFLSDHYSSFGTSGDTSSRSGTALGSSNHTSPSSHHSSPRALSDISETEKSRQSSLSVPTLPPIIQSPQQRSLCQGVQAFSPTTRPPSNAASSRSGGSVSSTLSKSAKSSSKTISIASMTRELSKDSSAVYYMNRDLQLSQDSSDDLLSDTFLDAFSRFEGVS